MPPDILQVLTLLFTALALVPSAAHLLELPNKINLSQDEYLTAQKLYRGWQFVGIVVIAALLSTVALALALRSQFESLVAAIVAVACIAGTQLIFWIFTFPVNLKTANWSTLPGDWLYLRRRWEYSHAAGAVLNLVAFIATSLAVIWSRNA
jgi:hypothetical protein